MTGPYQHLTLAQVQPGMILSDQLLDLQGQLLLQQGTVLTAAMLVSLAHHGIETLPVQVLAPCCEDDMGYPPRPDESGQTTAQRSARLAHLFRKNQPDNEADRATTVLHRLVEDFRLGVESDA